jgi:PAS domain S-box-containing protein
MLSDAALMFSEATLDLEQLLVAVTRVFVAGVASECSVELLQPADAARSESAERSEHRISLPLACRGEIVARATLTRSAGAARYGEDDLHWALRLAEHAGLAIGNAKACAVRRALEGAVQSTPAALEAEPRLSELGDAGSLGSERIRSEQQRASLAALVESSDDAIIGKSLAGVVTSWNEGARRLFGYSSTEIIGHSISLIVPPEREQEFVAALKAVSAGDVQRFDTVRRRKDGTLVDVSLTISPVRDTAGKVVSISKVARDVTARRHAERQLARAKETAEAASRELEAFSYSVAHDLRAPLRGMNGFAQVLLDEYGDKFDAEGRDWLNEILLNANRMGALIDALLSLSRVTRGAVRREAVNLTALARETAAALAAREPERDVQFAIQDDLRVEADLTLARALIDNLLGNAWKFTRKAAHPRISVGSSEREGERVFFVRDNGAGFDMAYVPKLFAPFQRLHSNTDFPGTGIGLATVQRIVLRHGGRIWADGTVDGGATFSFTLPNETSESPK